MRLCSMSATHVNDDAKYVQSRAVQNCTVRQHCHLECNSLWHTELMENEERVSDVVAASQIEDEPCCGILD